MRAILVASLLAGCSAELPPVAENVGALSSCNGAGDCPVPTGLGACIKVVCANHACGFAMDSGSCPTGCSVAATDCSLGVGSCYLPPCVGQTCRFDIYGVNTCACTMDPQCTQPPNSCQSAPTCTYGSCTNTAKQPLGASCCNFTDDCGGSATCSNNNCSCGTGNKFCPGGAPGTGRCVPSAGCCLAADCPAGNGCQARSCSMGGVCGFVSNGGAGCCDLPGDCGGGASCTNNVCTCAAGKKFCAGATPGTGRCIAPTGCCTVADCAARPNATADCVADACVYSCNAGFHDCGGVCKSNTSTLSCGDLCTACPTGNACQMPTCACLNPNCAVETCGLAAAGGSPCCNTTSDCVPANACQIATACTGNVCVFGRASAAGCCTTASDCPATTDPCLVKTCVANRCGTTPIPFCQDDGGAPADLSSPLSPPPDLAATGGGGAAGGGGGAGGGVADLPPGARLGGGGGCACAVGGHAPLPLWPLAALALLALRRRRRG